MFKHKGTVSLKTERLLLRKFRYADAEDMFNNWANDSDVTKYLTWQPHGSIEVTKEIIKSWISEYEKENVYNWAIVLNDTGKVIGSISVVNVCNEHQRCEVGYCMGKKYWNKGIMTEALKCVIKYLFFQVGINRIQAIHHRDNSASGKVMHKSGMKYEGRLKYYLLNNKGSYVDCDIYAILRGDMELR